MTGKRPFRQRSAVVNTGSNGKAIKFIGKGGIEIASQKGRTQGMEDNFKRAVMELLVLTLLNREDLPAVQIMQRIEEETGHAIGLVSPYMLFYRLIEDGCILEAYKKIAPDGRRRQYYQMTEEGKRYLEELTALYRRLTGGVELLMEGGEETNGT